MFKWFMPSYRSSYIMPNTKSWAPAGGLPAWSLSLSADLSHLLFWKASGSTASSFEMMTSPDFNLEMSRLSPLYLEFDYRYSVEDTSYSYSSLNEYVPVLGNYHNLPFEPENDGQWHSSGEIAMFPNVSPFYKISDMESIISEFMYIHFYADAASDYFDLDNIRLSRPTNAWVVDTDGDGLTDGQEVLQYGTSPVMMDTDMDKLWDGDEVNMYGTNPTNPDTDGDGLKDGDEVNVYGTDPRVRNERYAVIIGGTYYNDQQYEWFLSATKNMYMTLRDQYKYSDENIFYLFPLQTAADGEGLVDDDTPSETDIQNVFSSFKAGGTHEMDNNDLLFVVWVDHGDDGGAPDGIEAHNTYFPLHNGDKIYDQELANYVDGISGLLRFILQPCFSGGFINDLSGANRIILSAVRETETEGGWIEKFTEGLQGMADTDPTTGNNNGYTSIEEAYHYAAVYLLTNSGVHPQLDDNGDLNGHGYDGFDMMGIFDNGYDTADPSKDGYLAARNYI